MVGGARRGQHRDVLAVAATVLVFLVAGPLRRGDAHPLHTTLTEITTDPSRRTMRAVIRVFADDFGKAVGSAAHTGSATVTDAELRYLQKSFVVTGSDGRTVPLRACGVKRTVDLLWLCVDGQVPTGLPGARVRNMVLCDLYDDQVNIVRVSVGGTSHSLLFTRRETAKSLM